MIFLPKLFNIYNRLDRPVWQRWRDRRLMLMEFAGPLFWSTPEDYALVQGYYGPEADKIYQEAVSSFPYGGSTYNDPGFVLALGGATVSVFDFAPVEAGMRFRRNGELQRNDNGVYSSAGSNRWLLLSQRTSTIGDDFQARWEETGGFAGVGLAGWTEDTWSTINQDRQVQVVQFGGGGTALSSGTLRVRETAQTSNEASTLYSIDVEAAGGGILSILQ